MEINLMIPGEPIPQGRPRFNSKNKTARTPEKSRVYKKVVGFHALKQRPSKELIVGALKVEIVIYRSAPKSIGNLKKNATAMKNELIVPITTPDVDNYAKGIMDALTGLIWRDDGQVVELNVKKFYSKNPRATVKIKEL